MASDRKRSITETLNQVDIKRSKNGKQVISNRGQNFCEISNINDIRTRTFSHWSLKQPSKIQMIESGFFNCNIADRVICIYCNLLCQHWIPTDDPAEIHSILSPNCLFVKSNLSSTNVESRVILNRNLTPTFNNEIVPTKACNEQYTDLSKRLATFSQWDKEQPLPPIDDVVKAGFFYSGTESIITCFYCNGSLKNWKKNDKPAIAHARWFPSCGYVKQLCGDELYRKIQQWKRVLHQDQHQQNLRTLNNSSNTNSQSQGPDKSALSRLVAARLDLPVTQNLLNKFQLSIIKHCYEDQLRIKLDDFSSDSDLHMACLILQKQIEIIDGKKENIIIPSKKLQEITYRYEQEQRTLVSTNKGNCDSTIADDNRVHEEKSKQLQPTSKDSNVCVVCLTDEKRIACIPC
ncbi:unnamed protein product, partial [Didymodactylos carnosus]